MTSSIPGLPGSFRPATDDDLNKRLKTLEDIVAQLRQSLGAQTGFTFVDGKIMSPTFDGSLDTPAAGTTGVALGGPTDTIVVNNLILRGQIIGNDALTSPVQADTGNNNLTNFTINASPLERAIVTMTVPAGFTKALVMVASHVHGRNTTAGLSLIACWPAANGTRIDAPPSGLPAPQVDTPAGNTGGVSQSGSALLTGLTGGGTYTASTFVEAAANWGVDTINAVMTNVLALYLR